MLTSWHLTLVFDPNTSAVDVSFGLSFFCVNVIAFDFRAVYLTLVFDVIAAAVDVIFCHKVAFVLIFFNRNDNPFLRSTNYNFFTKYCALL